jgi:hypothetical protein
LFIRSLLGLSRSRCDFSEKRRGNDRFAHRKEERKSTSYERERKENAPEEREKTRIRQVKAALVLSREESVSRITVREEEKRKGTNAVLRLRGHPSRHLRHLLLRLLLRETGLLRHHLLLLRETACVEQERWKRNSVSVVRRKEKRRRGERKDAPNPVCCGLNASYFPAS